MNIYDVILFFFAPLQAEVEEATVLFEFEFYLQNYSEDPFTNITGLFYRVRMKDYSEDPFSYIVGLYYKLRM